MLDQQPFIFRSGLAQPYDHEASAQFLAVESKFQFAPRQLVARTQISFRRIAPLVPDNDLAAAVLALRNRPFEFSVLERMIFHLHCKPLVAGIHRRPFRHGPRFQDAVNFQSQVVVQPRSGVLLHHKNAIAGTANTARRFRSLVEMPFLPIFVKHAAGRPPTTADWMQQCSGGTRQLQRKKPLAASAASGFTSFRFRQTARQRGLCSSLCSCAGLSVRALCLSRLMSWLA